ncbi:alanine dehydrogenase [Fulvitalea axinellae]|uniref:Saccharopine dehydrogenase [NAD(+), L-lysine-forming] n=1 Tax=Fulvitalea axinellae TaxID=1182444 RepID=A0AAU9CRH1_9BACT|nr:alanine dehydrogenase [Fulvitalea axinellae]
MRIGIIKEGKVPVDHRVPFTPDQAKEIEKLFPEVEVKVESSDVRCFPDSDYATLGLEIRKDVEDCDVLFGVKEVPIESLIPNKTYFFFSHTIKKQPYNKDLLKAILAKNIRLIDYECLTNTLGQRVVAFGRYAGIVGAYNGLLTYGKKFDLFELKPAHQCLDMEELFGELDKVSLPGVKIALTGAGRVSNGSVEVLERAGIRRVGAEEFLEENFSDAVYAQLDVEDYNKRKDGGAFDKKEFFADPSGYESNFLRFLPHADILVAGAFWAPEAPALFTAEDVSSSDFNIKVVADITCDIRGSIPTTVRPSTIDDPIYDYEPSIDEAVPAFAEPGRLTVMAVDNLPCELPRDASASFGENLIKFVLPSLLGEDSDGIIHRATIAENGELGEHYQYLSDYAEVV